ncbi:AMP-binding protein [bacterium]|nr:AMP-binding protein [candidate division CSSED10-310 bacterium]
MAYTNVAVYLSRMARDKPFMSAIICPAARDRLGRVTYSILTFRQLDALSTRIGRGFLARRFSPGTRCVLMVTPSPEFFALTFGLLKSGIVPIMVDPGMGAAGVKQCIAEAGPSLFIGIPKAHLARILLGWGRSTIQSAVTVHLTRDPAKRLYTWGISLEDIIRSGTDDPFFDLDDPAFSDHTTADTMAAINFTSGSTGVPKGAIYTHGIFSAQVELIRKTYGIEPGEIDLCTFPLFALFAPALGMTAVIPDMDFTRPAQVDPRHIRQAMDDWGPTNMFGSPALLNTVGRWCRDSTITFPSLRRVICAGAPIQPAILQRFTPSLTGAAQVYSGYGATEAMPLASIGSRDILDITSRGTREGKGICVGIANAGIDLDIICITDEPIAEWSDSLRIPSGEIGEIVARGPIVTQAYFNRESATRTSKIFDPLSGRMRHRMGDLGWIDSDGRLWFCGRKSHRVVTPTGTLFTVPVEGVFDSHPLIFRTALVGIGEPGQQDPVLCIELEKNKDNKRRSIAPPSPFLIELRRLADQTPSTRAVHKCIFHPSFPVDIRHNSKIFREKLRAWVMRHTHDIILFSDVPGDGS